MRRRALAYFRSLEPRETKRHARKTRPRTARLRRRGRVCSVTLKNGVKTSVRVRSARSRLCDAELGSKRYTYGLERRGRRKELAAQSKQHRNTDTLSGSGRNGARTPSRQQGPRVDRRWEASISVRARSYSASGGLEHHARTPTSHSERMLLYSRNVGSAISVT